MPQSFTRIVLHTTFGTKFRRPMIRPEMEAGLYRFIKSRFAYFDCQVLEIEAVFDHIHIVHTLPRTKSIAEVVMDVKSRSTLFLKQNYPVAEHFDWQSGYASHSVNYQNTDRVRAYVRNQKRHHYGDTYGPTARLTFENEYEEIIVSLGVPYKPEYLFPTAPEGSSTNPA